MKKLNYALFLILFASLGIFAQTSAENKSEAKTKSSKLEAQREKFDPTRNAAEDLQNAIATAQKENKRIILDVGGEWCIWCRIMDFYLIENKDVAKIRDENFVWLKINMSPENENTEFLSKYPRISGYPHLFVLEKDATLLHSQDTAVLEEKDSYNKEKFTDFLNKWSPAKTEK